jgi:thiamine kinase-like enzyme
MLTSLVPEEILQSFFGDKRHHLELISTARFGASGPKVVFLRNGGPAMLALKYGNTRVPISKQFNNRMILAEYLHNRLPKIRDYCRYSEGEAMLMEAIDGPNLHEAVMLGSLPDEQILEVLKSIIDDFHLMWQQTKSTAQAITSRDPKARLERVRAAVVAFLSEKDIQLDDRLVVNGKELGTARSLLGRFDRYSAPQFSVICHSDLNADNIVVIPNNGVSWYIVDWEWVGRHDWRLSLSHLYGWWSSNATRLETTFSILRGRNRVEFVYELSMPQVCLQIQDSCLKAGEKIALSLGDEKNWRQQFDILVAALLLGDIRFAKERGRNQYTIPLIGEGFRLLANQV